MTHWLFLIVLGLLIFHITTRYNRRGRLIQKIPGPRAYPLVGNLFDWNSNSLSELWNIARRISDQYYPITRVWFVKTAIISIRHPDDLKILMTNPKCINKGFSYDYFLPWLKSGLLTSTAKKWRPRRKMLTPAFYSGILNNYLEIMDKESKKYKNICENGEQKIIDDLVHFCSTSTLNVVCEAAMAVSLDQIEASKADAYKKAVHNMGYITVYRSSRPYVKTWMLNFIRNIGSMHRNTLKTLHEFTNSVINDRRNYHLQSGNKYLKEFINGIDSTSEYEHSGPKKKLGMLDLLLAAEHKGAIDNEGIHEEVATFVFAGHDTTGMAMSFLLLLLAEHKESQNLARAEVNEVFDRNGGEIGLNNIQEFHYLERCIKETLRLFPPVPTLLRHVPNELQLKHAVIPADSHVIIHLYDLHRDPNFWEEPEKFDPDRFLPKNIRNQHTYAYIPFSVGYRNCIGQKFALIQLKILVARILKDYYLEPIDRSSDIQPMADIVLRPINPIRIKLIKINK